MSSMSGVDRVSMADAIRRLEHDADVRGWLRELARTVQSGGGRRAAADVVERTVMSRAAQVGL